SQGVIIQGDAAGDWAGRSVSAAGDVNGDGYDDLIVGAPEGSDGGDQAGEAYIIFGSDFGAIESTLQTGSSGADILIGNRAGVTLSGGGGADVFRGGAGDDEIRIPDLQ